MNASVTQTNALKIENMDLSSIPTMPAAAMKIMSMIFNEDVDIDALITTVKQDIALSSEIIKAANSPLYRPNDPIDNITNAIMHLGLDNIKKIVLSTSVFGTMKDQLSQENYSLLLSYSLATAAAAQILADEINNINSETAFIIGLFLNLGLFACAKLYPSEFETALKDARNRGLHLNTILEECLSIKLHDVSLKVAKQWRLPKSILEHIMCREKIALKHADPMFEVSPLSIISHLSMMAADVYFGTASIISIEKFKGDIKMLMGKKEDAASNILALLSDTFNNVSSTLDLDLPEQPKYTDILKKANKELLKINKKYELMYQELSDKNQEMLKLSIELDKRNQHLQKLVTTDPLTSLYNRRYLEKSLQRLIAESKRYDVPLSLIMLDIDFFKKINDDYGHQAGDEVLIKTSRKLEKTCRDSDILARFGGEEFIILLPHTNLKQAIIASEKCRKVLESEDFVLNMLTPIKTINVTASFGVATYSNQTNTPDSLIQSADKLLYQAKENGRNCVYPSMN